MSKLLGRGLLQSLRARVNADVLELVRGNRSLRRARYGPVRRFFRKWIVAQPVAALVAVYGNEALKASAGKIGELAERGHDLARQIDHVSKLFVRLVDTAEDELNARDDEKWSGREIRTAVKLLEEQRVTATGQLHLIRYFARHDNWLQERFPDGKLRDVEGLVKTVSFKDLEANDWSLTPGRYVGIAPQEEDEDFDFEETMRDIHIELSGLNAEAAELAATIAKNPAPCGA